MEEADMPTLRAQKSRIQKAGSPRQPRRSDSPATKLNLPATHPKQASVDRTQQRRKDKRQEAARITVEKEDIKERSLRNANRDSESSTTLEVPKRPASRSPSSQHRRPRHSSTLLRRKTTESSSPAGLRKWWMWIRGDSEDRSRGVSYIIRIYERERAETVCRLLYAGLFALFLLTFAYFVVRTLSPGNDVHVRTPMGLIDGTQHWVLEQNIFYYLGLPYASKPARFQRAAPLADQFLQNYVVPKNPNVRCLQVKPNGTNSAWPLSPAERGDNNDQPVKYSEDCLYLNVWSPAAPCDYASSSCDPAVPVLVVLFSVGFTRGGADWYDGAVLASLSGMVVVAPNFRLGPLAVPLKEKHPQGLPLLSSSEQLLAVQWTWDNIRHFGGNNSQINVLGAGGGAWTVGELLLSNRESFRDHIQRVALHGGSPLRRYEPISAYQVAKALGCGPTSSDCLDAADASLLDSIASRRLQGPPATLTVAEARPGTHHQVLLGYVAGQGMALFEELLPDMINGTGIEPPAEQWLGGLQERLNFTDLKALFDDTRKKTPPGSDVRVRFLEDLLVRCPIELFSDIVRGLSFTSYGFAYVTDPDDAVDDAPANLFPDLDLLFGVPITAPNHMYPERLKKASLLFMRAWSTFMKTGESVIADIGLLEVWSPVTFSTFACALRPARCQYRRRLPAVSGDPWPVLIEDTPNTALEVVIKDGFRLSAPTRFAHKTCYLINNLLKTSITEQDGEPNEIDTDGCHI